jgi:hypothetical protein
MEQQDLNTPDVHVPEQQPLTQRPLHSSAPKLSLNAAKFDISFDKIRKKWTIRTTVRIFVVVL